MPMYVTLVIRDNRIPTEPRDTTLSQEYLACLDDQTTSESFHPRSGRRVGDARRHLTEVNDSGKSKFNMLLLKCVYTHGKTLYYLPASTTRYVYVYLYITATVYSLHVFNPTLNLFTCFINDARGWSSLSLDQWAGISIIWATKGKITITTTRRSWDSGCLVG